MGSSPISGVYGLGRRPVTKISTPSEPRYGWIAELVAMNRRLTGIIRGIVWPAYEAWFSKETKLIRQP